MSLMEKSRKKKAYEASEELASFLLEMRDRKFCGRQIIMVSFGLGQLNSVDIFTESPK